MKNILGKNIKKKLKLLQSFVDDTFMFGYNGKELLKFVYLCNLRRLHFKLGGRETTMSKTVVRKNESLDDALRRFKRSVSKTGTLQEYRKREFYEKPSVKRKKKSEAARKRKNKKRF